MELRPFREWVSPLSMSEPRPAWSATPRYWGSGIGAIRGTGHRGGGQLWFVKGSTWTAVTPSDRRIGSSMYSYGVTAWTPWSKKKALVLMGDRSTLALVHREHGIDREFPLDGTAQGYPVRWSSHEFAYVADFGPRRGRAIVVVDITTGLSRHVYETFGLIGDLCVSLHGGHVAWLEWPSGTMPWERARAFVAPRSYLRVRPNEVPTPGGAVANLTFHGSVLHGVCESVSRFVPFTLRDGLVTVREDFPGEGRSDWLFSWRWTAHLDDATAHVSLHEATTTLVLSSGDGGPLVTVENASQAIQEIDGHADRFVVLGSDATGSSLVEYRRKKTKWKSRRLDQAPPSPPVAVTGEVRRTSTDVPFVYYEPSHPDVTAPVDDRPGLIVHIHGGPTATSGRGYRLDMQFFASSGFAVASVEYRGSTGYGADYRRALNGRYGEAEVSDVLSVVSYLIDNGEVDPSAVYLRGGSSGGMTALLCAEDDRIAGAIAHYPVTDVAQLHEATHEAECGYLEDLVGRLPESAEKFREISPQFRSHSPRRALIFQGDSDQVVPAFIVREYVEELRRRGVEVTYHEFSGEGHGFRLDATKEAVAAAELRFLRP